MKVQSLTFSLIVVLSFCAGCNQPRAEPASKSNLTAGMAKKTIVKGQTTQVQVMEIFGPPDLVTHANGREVWTYDKIKYEVESSAGYFNVLIAGTGSSRSSGSSTSTMLIVYFDRDIVQDYKMSVAKF